jgi:hypothetical protein
MAWVLMVVSQGQARALASPSNVSDATLTPRTQATTLMLTWRFRHLAPLVKDVLIARAQHDTASFEVTSHDGAVYFFQEHPDGH